MNVNENLCQFLQTEVYHDLKPPVNATINRNQSFVNSIRQNTGCNSVDTDMNFYDDPGIVTKIFSGITIKKLISDPNYIPSNNQSQQVNTKSGTKIVIIKRVNKPYNSTLLDLFNYHDTGNELHTYNIIDTGDNLFQTLKGLTPPQNQGPTPNYIFNIINTYHTIGDSAPKTRPDSKKYASQQNNRIQLRSWLYIPPDTQVSTADSSYLISTHTIKSKIYGINWNIRQDWHDTANILIHQTFDSKKDNSKPTVREQLAKLLNSQTLVPAEISKTVQKKRSGDYLQVESAAKFPELSSDPNQIQNYSLIRPHPNPGIYLIGQQQLQNQAIAQIIKNSTYFITGDWPAFAYAVYQGINSVMIFKHPSEQTKSCTICVQF
jgi:hypothetical protein